MPRPAKWTLADRIDFEALTVADERATDPEAIAARDARLWQERIAPSLTPEESTDREVVFHRWLEARRASETPPGKWFTNGWYWFNAGAVGGGLVFGFAVASGALYYAGARPVNVAVFLAITVGVQWILLLWTVLVILFRGVRAASQQVLARIGEGIGQALASALGHLSGEQQVRLRAELASLRQLSGRNLRPIAWMPLVALQLFGIVWNGGVLLALFARVIFTDVAFGWESTLARGPEGMHSLANTLAMPWSWFLPNACPTLDQVEHSWFHYQTGVAALDRMATTSWWPWLAMVVLIYGLAPRFLLFCYFRLQLSVAMRRLSFDEPRHRAAWYRLTGPVISSHRPPNESEPAHAESPSSHANQKVETGCLLIASSLSGARTEIKEWVTRQLGWKLACTEIAEIDYPSGNDALLTRLATLLPQAPAWLVVVPAPFTAFSAFTQFVGRLDRIADTTQKAEGLVLVVALDAHGKPTAPPAEWMRYWTDFLRAEAPGCVTLSYKP